MVKRLLGESSALTLLALLGAVLTWTLFGGPQERETPCDPDGLRPGEICLADAQKLSQVLWVDARTRELWQKNGVPGSILLTDHPSEDFPTLMSEAFEHLATTEAVIVYCASEGCGSSEPIAQKIRELGLLPPENIFVLAGGWKALNLE